MIPGLQMEEISKALLDAYDTDSLSEMLRYRLNKKLGNIVAPGALETVVFKLLDKADMQGWQADLVREAHRANPGNIALLKVYEKFGMAPTISLAEAGEVIPDVDAKPSSSGLQKIISEKNPTLEIDLWRNRLTQVEARVCRIDIANRGTGTGFLVGPDTVLTNYHVVEAVISGKKPAAAVSCLFDYKVLADSTQNQGIRVQLAGTQGILAYAPYSEAEKAGKPETAEPTEDELDFALLRLERPFANEPSGAARGFEVLPQWAADFETGMGLIIAQHPSGAPMKLAIDTQSVISVNSNATRVRYKTNTEGGSSGSPVYDMFFTLCALHHYGDPSFQHPQYNQGIVPLHLIRKKIADAGFADHLG